MTALLEPTECCPHKLRVSYEGGKPVRAVIEGIEFAPAPCAEPPMGPSPGYREVTIDRNAVAQEPDDDALMVAIEALRKIANADDNGRALFTPRSMQLVASAALDRLQAKAPDALEQIAEFLVEQRNEPWPGGTDATRLHYWRDKAIEGARRLRAPQAPETGE